MKSILEKEQTYKKQMAPIREIVWRFAEPRGWTWLERGRTAHASICGPIHDLEGVIDIIFERTDWEQMPDALFADTPISLWASAYQDRDGTRFHAPHELHWEAPFGDLLKYTETFSRDRLGHAAKPAEQRTPQRTGGASAKSIFSAEFRSDCETRRMTGTCKVPFLEP